ncbi:hypothetical protein Tsubulata_048569 [Turnera subulata]|uniref:H(+)-exporting diphosphatase n=1 Tax=Turnera subulata TaxID=218843 RepID=A0A9Q0JJH3_9ROSI|nr:hypothetical protein Tsubulata_048569 [Turnera subulata]
MGDEESILPADWSVLQKISIMMRVPSVEEAVNFYREAFGAEECPVPSSPEEEVNGIRATKLDIRFEFPILITDSALVPEITPPGAALNLCLQVNGGLPDLEAAVARAVNAGATTDGVVVLDPTSGRPSVRLADPFGAVWFLYVPSHHEILYDYRRLYKSLGVPVEYSEEEVLQHGRSCKLKILLNLPDPVAAAHFYSTAFGAVPPQFPTENEIPHLNNNFAALQFSRRYYILISQSQQKNNLNLNLNPSTSSSSSSSSPGGTGVILCARTHDVDALVKRLQQAGAVLEGGIVRDRFRDMAKLRDPFGVLWFIHQLTLEEYYMETIDIEERIEDFPDPQLMEALRLRRIAAREGRLWPAVPPQFQDASFFLSNKTFPANCRLYPSDNPPGRIVRYNVSSACHSLACRNASPEFESLFPCIKRWPLYAAWFNFGLCGLVGIITAYASVWITKYHADYKLEPLFQFLSLLFPLSQPFGSVNTSAFVDEAGNPTGRLFGTAVATMGMLSTAAYVLTMDMSAPIADSAGGIVAMSQQVVAVAVGRTAQEVVNEVRRQFIERPGIMNYKEKPDYGHCVAILASPSLREMIKPGCFGHFYAHSGWFCVPDFGTMMERFDQKISIVLRVPSVDEAINFYKKALGAVECPVDGQLADLEASVSREENAAATTDAEVVLDPTSGRPSVRLDDPFGVASFSMYSSKLKILLKVPDPVSAVQFYTTAFGAVAPQFPTKSDIPRLNFTVLEFVQTYYILILGSAQNLDMSSGFNLYAMTRHVEELVEGLEQAGALLEGDIVWDDPIYKFRGMANLGTCSAYYGSFIK